MEYQETLNRKIQQFLVHSFLYYNLNETLIDDGFYDRICMELVELKSNNEYKNHKYSSYIEGLDTSGSGFYITQYPPKIISTAFRLLYNDKVKNGSKESFDQLIRRWGYSVIK